MMTENVDRAVAATVAVLQELFGDYLQTVYLYGSLAGGYYQAAQSDVNLMAVLANETPLSGEDGLFHAFRSAFQPLWQAHGATLRRPPMLVTRSGLARHLALNPLLAFHLSTEGRPVAGVEPGWPAMLLDPVERVASLAVQTRRASAALAPELLEPEAAQKSLAKLRRLVRGISRRYVDEKETAVALFGEIQSWLASEIAHLPADFQWTAPVTSDAPPLLAQLVAIYERMDTLVFLLPDLTPAGLAAINWSEIAATVEGQYVELQVTTAAQLRLGLRLETPLAFCLNYYKHTWGADPVAGLQFETWRLWREVARLPSFIQTTALPQAYLSNGDAHKVIHDFQNKLLNIQLQHELLKRLQDLSAATPPRPLPDPSAPNWQRIDAILEHAAWWADYYRARMKDEG